MSALGMSKEKNMLEEMLYPKLEYRSVKKDYDISKKVKASVCDECGGACCKAGGCCFSPDDFKDTSFEGLKKVIKKGYISIDYVDRDKIQSNIGVYILRIRNQGAPIVDIGGYKRSTQCILLTEEGCKLDYEHRPTQWKLLIPNTISSFCHEMACDDSQYTIEDCCYEWMPHKKVLHQLIQYFKEKEDIPYSL